MRSSSGDVLALALELLGNLAFARPNRGVLLASDGLKPLLARLASVDTSSDKPVVRISAIRALAILGAPLPSPILRQVASPPPILCFAPSSFPPPPPGPSPPPQALRALIPLLNSSCVDCGTTTRHQ